MKLDKHPSQYGLKDLWLGFGNMGRVMALLRRSRVQSRLLVFSAAASFAAVLLHLLAIRLLIPLAQGVIRDDYLSIRDTLGITQFLHRLEPRLMESPAGVFLVLASLVLLCVLVKNAADYAAARCTTRQVRSAESHLRELVFERHLKFGKLYFDRRNIGDIHHVIIAHSQTVANQLRVYHSLLSGLMGLAAFTGMMLWISWKLCLVAWLALPIFPLVMNRLVASARDESFSWGRSIAQVRRIIFNLVSCIPLVKVNSTYDAEKKRFSEAVREEAAHQDRIDRVQAMSKPLQDLGTFISLLFIAFAINWAMRAEHSADLPRFLVFFYLVHLSIPRFAVFHEFGIGSVQAQLSLKRLEDALNDEGKHIVPEGTERWTGLREALRVRDLDFSYRPGVPVLKGLTLDFPKGATTALVGPTGSGKTTVAHLLLRLYDCPPGTLFVDDADLRSFTGASLAEAFAFAGQDTLLFNDTLLANLTYGLGREVSEAELDEVLRSVRLDELVRRLPEGLRTRIGDSGAGLSGGEKQRFSLARALLKRSEVLIVDEVSSSLDALTEEAVQRTLERSARGRTCIVITHRLALMRSADRIAVLENGSLKALGNFEALTAPGGALHGVLHAHAAAGSIVTDESLNPLGLRSSAPFNS